MKSFLNLSGKTFLVVGFANKKHSLVGFDYWSRKDSVIYSVRNDRRKEELESLLMTKARS